MVRNLFFFFSVSFPLLPRLTPSLLRILLSSVFFAIPSLPPISFSFLFLPLSPLFSPLPLVMFWVNNAKVEIWEQYQKSFSYIFHRVFKSLVWVNQEYVLKNMLLIKIYWRLLLTNVSVFIWELRSPFQFGYMNYVFCTILSALTIFSKWIPSVLLWELNS